MNRVGSFGESDSKQIETMPMTAWWPAMNYWLTVPLLFAAKTQLTSLNDVELAALPDSDAYRSFFCTSLHGPYRNEQGLLATNYWSAYFARIAELQKLASIEQQESVQQQLATLMWRAHSQSLIYAEPIFRHLLEKESIVERGLLLLVF
jgi:hypothetical protein